MLVIRRKTGQAVDIKGPAEITVLGTSRGEARLGIVTDETVSVERLGQMVPEDIHDMMRAYIDQQVGDAARFQAVARLRRYLDEVARV